MKCTCRFCIYNKNNECTNENVEIDWLASCKNLDTGVEETIDDNGKKIYVLNTTYGQKVVDFDPTFGIASKDNT